MNTTELRQRLAKCIELTKELRQAMRLPEAERSTFVERRLVCQLEYELELLDEEV